MRAYRNLVMFKSDISYLIFSKHHNIIAGIVRQVTESFSCSDRQSNESLTVAIDIIHQSYCP